jgi:hypothetical protein
MTGANHDLVTVLDNLDEATDFLTAMLMAINDLEAQSVGPMSVLTRQTLRLVKEGRDAAEKAKNAISPEAA